MYVYICICYEDLEDLRQCSYHLFLWQNFFLDSDESRNWVPKIMRAIEIRWQVNKQTDTEDQGGVLRASVSIKAELFNIAEWLKI